MRWLRRSFTRPSRQDSATALWIYVVCGRCEEAIRVRVDRRYDLVSEMRDPGESGPAYTLHKDIVGRRCFQRIAVDVAFDQRRQMTERHISGGRWLTEEEYRSTTRASAPPPSGEGGGADQP
jgi:hypothetical protein